MLPPCCLWIHQESKGDNCHLKEEESSTEAHTLSGQDQAFKAWSGHSQRWATTAASYAHTQTHENPGPRPSGITATLQCSPGKGSGSFHKKIYWLQDKLKHYEHSRFFHPWRQVKLESLLKNFPDIIISESSNELSLCLCHPTDFYEVFTATWMAMEPLQSKNKANISYDLVLSQQMVDKDQRAWWGAKSATDTMHWWARQGEQRGKADLGKLANIKQEEEKGKRED